VVGVGEVVIGELFDEWVSLRAEDFKLGWTEVMDGCRGVLVRYFFSL